jgi:hypothetical protein
METFLTLTQAANKIKSIGEQMPDYRFSSMTASTITHQDGTIGETFVANIFYQEYSFRPTLTLQAKSLGELLKRLEFEASLMHPTESTTLTLS